MMSMSKYVKSVLRLPERNKNLCDRCLHKEATYFSSDGKALCRECWENDRSNDLTIFFMDSGFHYQLSRIEINEYLK